MGTTVRRSRFALGASAVAVAGAASLAAGFASASGATHTNNRGGTVGVVGGSAGNAAGDHYFTLAASAFAPDGLHTTTEDYFNQFDPSTLSNLDINRCFDAAADLPNGAKIVSVTFYYTASTTPMAGEFTRQDLANHTDVVLASFTSATNTTPTYTHTTIRVAAANQTVNTQDAYALGACPNGPTTFSGVQIAYTG